jgi:hypothetical protein
VATIPEDINAAVDQGAETSPARRGRKPKVQATMAPKALEVLEIQDHAPEDLVKEVAEVAREASINESIESIEGQDIQEVLEPVYVPEPIKKEPAEWPKEKSVKTSLWQKLFGRKKVVLDAAPPVLEVQISDEELGQRIAETEKLLQRSNQKYAALEAENYKRQLSIEENQVKVDEIQNFISGVERSYIWRVQKIMDSTLAKAEGDLSEFEKAVGNVETPEEGRLLALRKRFHKAVAITFAITGGISALAVFYPILYRLDLPAWLQVFVYSDFFTSSLVALGVLAAGLIFLVRRYGGKEKMPTRRIFTFGVFFILFYVLVASWPIIEANVSSKVIPFLRDNIWEILTACASTFVFVLVVALAIYYQGWSVFRRDVTEQLARLNNVIEGYVHTKQEIGRLSSLNRQTSDWLKILAHTLFRPWKTHPDWDGTREFEKHFSTFPFALRVAQAQEEKDSRMAELERLVGARLLVQGWRSSAFADLVKFAGEEIGLQEGKFTLDTLDNDLPHQTNNSRALLLRFLEHSAATQTNGELDLQPIKIDEAGNAALQPSDRYLVEVARGRLLDLVEKTQSIVLSQARPRVAPIQEDPLLEIREDQGGIDEYDPTYSWDDFLRESLGTDEVAQPPMGILNFSDKGQINRVQENPSSFVITPRRLADALPAISSNSVRLVPVGDDKARAVEIIARVDVVGPLPFDDIAVLAGGSHVPLTTDVDDTWDDDEVL